MVDAPLMKLCNTVNHFQEDPLLQILIPPNFKSSEIASSVVGHYKPRRVASEVMINYLDNSWVPFELEE